MMKEIIRILPLALIFSTSSLGVICQTAIEVSTSRYRLNMNNLSEANFMDSSYLTYEINCINQIDSIHLKSTQIFDTTSCDLFKNKRLKINKNDNEIQSVLYTVIWSDSNVVDSVFKVSPNCYNHLRIIGNEVEFMKRIEIATNSLLIYTPLNYFPANEAEERLVEFDSLNYELSKYFFENGFLSRFEHATFRNGKVSSSYNTETELNYLLFKIGIHITTHVQPSNYKELTIIHFKDEFGMQVMSKFLLTNLLSTGFVGGVYDPTYPIILSHFPEFLQKIR